MHRITLMVGLCMTCLVMTAACGGQDSVQQAGGDDPVVEEVGKVMANLDQAEAPKQQDPVAMDELGSTDPEASADDEASAEAGDGEADG